MSLTRVTSTSMSSAALRGMQASLSRAQKLQEQLSSLKAVSRPSDDPAATVAAMKLRSQQAADGQYLLNIQDAQGRLNVADDALTGIADAIRNAQQVMISSQTSTPTAESRGAMGAQLDAIGKSIIDLYNSRWLDRPVFGGTVTGSKAMDDTGTYLGNDAPITARVSRDVTMRIDVKGTDAAADSLPGILQQAATDIVNNPDAISSDLDHLSTALTSVLTTLGDVGARSAQLGDTKNTIQSEQLDFQSRISEREDVDIPKTIMDLQSQQTAYQTALAAAGKILQVSLVDFLK